MFSNLSDSILVKFSENYAQIHGRILFPLTIFGILASIVTIIVLNKKNFRTPTNLILQHVAFFDTIVLISYNIYSLYFYIIHQPNPFVGQSSFWPWFAIFHSNIGLTAHSIALLLTCLLAIIRYIMISKPKQVVVNSTHVTILVWFVALLVCLLMIPNYLTWSVVSQPAYIHLPHLYTKNSTEIVYWVNTATGERLEKISFVLLALCFKILPVFILIVFSILLILNIHHARQVRERLHHHYLYVSSTTSNSKRELRTTRMLVFITLFTALVEFPQGLLFIASGIDKSFFYLYSHLGDVWDMTSISSSFITFIMYCLMSQQFRVEIYALILPKCLTKNSI
ncbi:unnamed protein product [Rotaria sp. Silwood2]|nr:unnamed protein product [Rotaria sp. Silwood2]CAF2855462.1 unnamed protein product [Rotaria sp. Silwood2]CAF3077405.1 unnamed protein product [Rotaria sp. Silwood2]CAF4376986.1 unnamed protein product [Rotaria sp. Silwood2]CAF4379138.1 unnamed protein product [Rotaria sp. Silwood2]